MTNKQYLNEITYLRPVIVFLIVVNHSFAVYSGVWNSPWGDSAPNIPLYVWIQRFAISCTLQVFTFVSGYVYEFQLKKKTEETLSALINNKSQRLLIPYVVFSVVYYIICVPFGQFSLLGFFHELFYGMGHLWFLLMLFWVFVVHKLLCNILSRCKYQQYILLIISLLFTYLPSLIPPILGLRSFFAYYFYFVLGTFILKMVNLHTKSYSSIRKGLVFFALFVSFWLIYYWMIGNGNMHLSKVLIGIITKSVHIVMCATGIVSVLCVTRWLSNNYQPSKLVKYLSSCSFGIYIFHQTILQFLYYRTGCITQMGGGKILLPWMGLVISYFLSILLTVLLKKTEFGRAILK